MSAAVGWMKMLKMKGDSGHHCLKAVPHFCIVWMRNGQFLLWRDENVAVCCRDLN